MAKKKRFGALLDKQVKEIPVVKQKAPKTISTNVSTGGMRSAVSGTAQNVAKSARQKAEEERSARMRQGLSSIVRSSFKRQMSRPTYINKSTINRLNQLNKTVTNPLAPIKQKQVTGGNGVGEQKLFSKERSLLNNTKFVTGGQGVGGKTVANNPIGRVKSSVLAPIKEDIQNNPYDAVRKVGMKGSRNERRVYVPMSQRDENGQISTNQRRLENAARGGNRKAGVEAALARTKAQTLSGHTYDQYVNAELNKKGLLGQDYLLRSKDPSKEAMEYRQRYGFDKEALDRVLAIANNTPVSGDYNERFSGQDNGSAVDRIKFGLEESYRARNIEDTLRRQYGVELTPEQQEKLDAVRSSGGYMVGNMVGQMSQYALTRGALSGLGMVGRGAKAAETGLKALKNEMIIDQAASVPLNMLDAMKEDNLEGVVKRFGLNQTMDFFFGIVTEGFSIARNPLYRSAKAKHNVAKEALDAGDTAAATAIEQSAKRDLDSIPTKELDKTQDEIMDALERKPDQEESDVSRDIYKDTFENYDHHYTDETWQDLYDRTPPTQEEIDEVSDIINRGIDYEDLTEREQAIADYISNRDLKEDIEASNAIEASARGWDRDVDWKADSKQDKIQKRVEGYKKKKAEAKQSKVEEEQYEKARQSKHYVPMKGSHTREGWNEIDRAYSEMSIAGLKKEKRNLPKKVQDNIISADDAEERAKLIDSIIAEKEKVITETEQPPKTSPKKSRKEPKTEQEKKAFEKAEKIKERKEKLKKENKAEEEFKERRRAKHYTPMKGSHTREGWNAIDDAYSEMSVAGLKKEKKSLPKKVQDNVISADDAEERAKLIDSIIAEKQETAKAAKAAKESAEPKKTSEEPIKEKAEKVTDDSNGDLTYENMTTEQKKVFDEAYDEAESRGMNPYETEEYAYNAVKNMDNAKTASKESAEQTKKAYKDMSDAELFRERKDALHFEELSNDSSWRKEVEDELQNRGLVGDDGFTEAERKAANKEARDSAFNKVDDEEEQGFNDSAKKQTEQTENKTQKEKTKSKKQTDGDEQKANASNDEGRKRAEAKGDKKSKNGRFKGAYVSKEKWKNGTPKRVNGIDTSKAFDSAWANASDEERKILDEMLMSGEIKKDTVNIRDLLTESYQRVRTKDGLEETIEKLSSKKRNKEGMPKKYNNSAEYISDFAAVRDRLQAMGDDVRLSSFTQDAIENVSDAGLQMRLWREIIKYSRAGKERLVNRVVDDIESSMEKYLHGNHVVKDKDLLEKFLSENDPELAAEYYGDLLVDMWNQVPAGKKEKADAWRYLSMLANPKTHARNIMGNTMFKVPRKMKDMLSVLVENHYEKTGLLKKEQRTKSRLTHSDEDMALRKQGKEEAKSKINVIKGEAKFNTGNGAGKRPTENKNTKIFSAGQENKKQNGLVGIWNRSKLAKNVNKGMDVAVQKSSRLLDWEDEINIVSTFEKTYARVAKARGYTAEFLANNPKAQHEIIEIATKEAQKSTYRDPSAVANWFSKHLRAKPSDSAIKKLAMLPFDAEVPFVKVPINMAKRAIGYSPANVVRGLALIRKAKKAGDGVALTKAIDSFCEGLSGTGIFGAGMFLADRFEIDNVVDFEITGKLGDDNEGYYKKDLGYQDYALNLTFPMADDGQGKTISISLDWLAPMSIPFFMGVATRREIDDDFEVSDIGSLIDTLAGAMDPFFEQSFMQGPSGMLEAIRKTDENPALALTGHAISNYVNQFIPTAAGQAARIIDPVRRDTSSTAENQTTRAIEKTKNKIIAKIPVASKTLQPYINAKGEEEVSRKDSSPKEYAKSIFLNAVSPAYVKEINETPVDKMIQDVNDHVDETVSLSSYPSKNTLKLNGIDHRMSKEDLTTYKRAMGTGQYQKLEQLRNSAEFKAMSWNEKQKAINNTIADARADAKDKTLLKMGFSEIEVYTDSLNDNQKSYAQQAQEAGIKPKEFRDLMTDDNISTDGNSNRSQQEVYDYLNSQTNLTNEQKALIWNAYNKSWKKNPYLTGEAPRNATTTAKGHSKSSSSSGKKGRSGRRSSGSSAKARAKTASEKRFSALQTGKAPTNAKGITALSSSAKGLTKAQKKALVKLMQKKLNV